MSNLYLVRHGQAGTRDAYDSLSQLGKRQCQLLGEWLAAQEIKFAAGYAGEMSRQQETAQAVSEGYGDEFPQIAVDSAWNEFDLERMYREIAPQLCTDNPDFRREFEIMRRQVHASGGAHDANVHRRWLPCDTALVEAWIAGKHGYAGESWQQFHQRVVGFRSKIDSGHGSDNIALFTSATPVAIWAGLAFDIADTRVMKLAGALRNASFTVVKCRDDCVRLFSFNETPHLASPDLRTFR